MIDFYKAQRLYSMGYYIGPRDPERNKAFNGRYMVCADVFEGPSDDASDTRFCVVGDNLDELVNEAYDLLGE